MYVLVHLEVRIVRMYGFICPNYHESKAETLNTEPILGSPNYGELRRAHSKLTSVIWPTVKTGFSAVSSWRTLNADLPKSPAWRFRIVLTQFNKYL